MDKLPAFPRQLLAKRQYKKVDRVGNYHVVVDVKDAVDDVH